MTAIIDDSPSTARPSGKRSARPGGRRASGQIRNIRARRLLAQVGQPATAVPAPILDGREPDQVWVAAAFLLGTIAREVLSDPDAGRALLHALDLSELDQALGLSLSHPPPGPPGRHHRHLTHGETRVLHYLPTNLSAREIAGELYLSVNTVKTHQRHLYQKLGARNRTQAVQQARAVGLLGSSSRQAITASQRAHPLIARQPPQHPRP